MSYVLPDFSILGLSKEQLAKNTSLPTDFNDLFVGLMDKGLPRPDALKEIARQVVPAPIPHSEVLGRLINKVSAINFREYASLNDDADLRNNHYQIIVVEHLMAIAKANHWGICKNIDFTYLFNGAYWNLLDENDLKIFLGNAAEKMGVERYKARYFNFKEHLYKQFLSGAHLPKPETPTESICVNLKNGTFEFTKEKFGLKGFDSNDFLTYQLPFEFQSDAAAPLFDKYMEKVLPEKQLRDILAEFIGYIFIPNGMLKLEKMLLLYGGGANGKSVFYEVIKSLLGEINISAHSLQSLTDDTGYYRAMIANKLVNYGSELSGGLASSVFKQLSSGEPVEARLPYGKPFTIANYAKLVFNCNELPKDVEHSEAYFRRFLIIPFEVTIPEKEQDKQLSQKIISQELSGVFNWVLEGLKRLLKNKNFTESDTVKRVRAQYELESDSVKTFLHEKNYKAHTKQYVMLGSLYDEYKQFCFDDGFKPLNKTNFRKRLEASKYEVKRQNIGMTVSVQKEKEQTSYSYQGHKDGEA